jgi:hypothetical protein
MTARQRFANAIAENLARHVRAFAEMAALAIVRGPAGRAEELADIIGKCEETHKRLVQSEALRRLSIPLGRRARRRIEESI